MNFRLNVAIIYRVYIVVTEYREMRLVHSMSDILEILGDLRIMTIFSLFLFECYFYA